MVFRAKRDPESSPAGFKQFWIPAPATDPIRGFAGMTEEMTFARNSNGWSREGDGPWNGPACWECQRTGSIRSRSLTTQGVVVFSAVIRGTFLDRDKVM